MKMRVLRDNFFNFSCLNYWINIAIIKPRKVSSSLVQKVIILFLTLSSNSHL
jgi:hypothetical protein